tara:strand:- start:820 stop:2046 length:1227 start_codon:yes stop_codon:yes gene_type:complete
MYLIILFIILIILSAFFSGLETSLFHLKSHQKVNKTVKKLLSNPKKLLASLLTGNTIVNIAIGTLAAYYTLNYIESDLPQSYLLLIEVILVTSIILIFGEIIPKTYAIIKSDKLSNFLAKTLDFVIKMIYPITFIFLKTTELIVAILPIKKEEIFDSEEELKMLAEVGEEEGTLKQTESDMIQSVFEFKNKLIKEILTPRVDVIALDSNYSLDQAMDIIMEKKYSKLPVYKNSIDNIKGILYAKDIVPYLIGSRPQIDIIKLSREPYFVPETKPIDELLQEFKTKKTNIAVVVDEWGGTSGIVTLEDVVEEVMGELRDPFDSEEYEIIKQKDGSMIVDGSIKIYDLEENLNVEFPDEREYDTLAGFILDFIGEIPDKGVTATYKNYIFKVVNIYSNRIDKVEIRTINE